MRAGPPASLEDPRTAAAASDTQDIGQAAHAVSGPHDASGRRLEGSRASRRGHCQGPENCATGVQDNQEKLCPEEPARDLQSGALPVTGPRIDVDLCVLYVDTLKSSSILGAPYTRARVSQSAMSA